MSAFAFFFSASNILAGLLCLVMGIYLVAKSRTPLSRAYCLLTGTVFLTSLALSFFWLATNHDLIFFWYIVSTACWLMVFAAIYETSIRITEVQGKNLRWAYLLFPLFFVMVVLDPHYISGFGRAIYGNLFIPGPIYPLFPIFYLCFMSVALWWYYQVYKHSPFFYRRKQARFLLITVSLSLVFGTILESVLPLLHLPTLYLAVHYIALTLCLIGVGILRYSPIAASPEQIAEAAAAAMLDALILTDRDQIINYANPAAADLTSYRPDQLLGKKISLIISGQTVKTRDGRSFPIELKSVPLPGELGFINIVRDLSEIARAGKTTRQLLAEEETLIAREQENSHHIFELMEKPLTEITAAWQTIQKEHPDLSATVRATYAFYLRYTATLAAAREARDKLATKSRELESFNQFMIDREKACQELEKELAGLIS